MKVRATKDGGYYNLKRRKEGEVFEMKDEHFQWKQKDKDDKIVDRVCTWVEPASNKQKAKEKPGAKQEDNEDVI